MRLHSSDYKRGGGFAGAVLMVVGKKASPMIFMLWRTALSKGQVGRKSMNNICVPSRTVFGFFFLILSHF
ncbi:hypothetical protein BU24DRAFT_242029 [Aaosphaeria arxii CBS 175.79]|uniref:Uncharacterized protein n=1 Tax=Aaosphaeria arxii CBS 175.79 TaxID=1450172 RepID=A0A6A5XLE7_9PLEO|nr:uncharacterized protein BU24DRAFT_242029 [Aaosphaeria arxii CBS 175.79]KAF2013637.1 hypothetical protein BU24DRAFT_242029 [Aaosphaeria arxii CBS 175.79]